MPEFSHLTGQQKYSKIGATMDLNSWNYTSKLILFLSNILFSLAIAAIAAVTNVRHATVVLCRSQVLETRYLLNPVRQCSPLFCSCPCWCPHHMNTFWMRVYLWGSAAPHWYLPSGVCRQQNEGCLSVVYTSAPLMASRVSHPQTAMYSLLQNTYLKGSLTCFLSKINGVLYSFWEFPVQRLRE